MNNDLISREALKKAVEELKRPKAYSEADVRQNVVIDCVLHIINNAPTVKAFTEEDMAGAYNEGYACGGRENERPQGGQVVPDMLQGWRYEENEKGGAECMDEDAKQASIPYTYNAPQHDWKCGYPDITKGKGGAE